MGERRLSRFTYNDATKTLDPNSEIIIHRYMTQVYSCCHLGGSMDLDSQGNLYFATGDNTGNAPNSTNGGYTNSHPQYTIPCPGGTGRVPTSTGCGVDTTNPDGPACADATGAAPGRLRGRLRLRLEAPTTSATPTRARPRATRTRTRAS